MDIGAPTVPSRDRGGVAASSDDPVPPMAAFFPKKLVARHEHSSVAPAEAAGAVAERPVVEGAESAMIVADWLPELADAKARSLTWPLIDVHGERIEPGSWRSAMGWRARRAPPTAPANRPVGQQWWPALARGEWDP